MLQKVIGRSSLTLSQATVFLIFYSKETELTGRFGLVRTISHQGYHATCLGIALGLSATTTQKSLSPMHHRPESRLAQSWAHIQERPESALVGSIDTLTLGKFQEKGQMVPDNKWVILGRLAHRHLRVWNSVWLLLMA